MDMALQILTDVATFIFVASLKSTALLALLLLVLAALGRLLSPGSRYLLWSVLLVSLLMPIGFPLPLPAGLPLEPDDSIVTATPAAAIASVPQVSPPIMAAEANSVPGQSAAANLMPAGYANPDPLSWHELLSLLWLVGVLAVLVTTMVISRRVAALAAGATPPPAQLQEQFLSCREQAACRARVRLAVSRELTSPLVCGLFRPVLLWPENLESQLETEQVRYIFLHELMHVKRQDLISATVVALIQALHWFNPAIWLAFARMRQDRELACDASTRELLGQKQISAYAHTLIQLAASMPQQPVRMHGMGMLDDHSLLKRRITMLARDPGRSRFQSALTGLLLLVFSVFAVSQPATEQQDAAAMQRLAPPVTAQAPAAQMQVQEATASPLPQLPEAPVASVPAATLVDTAAATIPASPPASMPVATALQQQIAEAVALPAATDVASAAGLQLLTMAAPAAEVPLPEPQLMLAAAVPPDPAAATQPAAAVTQDELVCLQLKLDGSNSTRICDTLAQWSLFESRTGLEPGSIFSTAATAQPGDAFILYREECRKEKFSVYFQPSRKEVCRGAEEWALIDERRAEDPKWTRPDDNWYQDPLRWVRENTFYQTYIPPMP